MKLRKDLIYREEDALLFDTKQGKLIELNESANIIVRCLIQNAVEDEMLYILQKEFPASSREEISSFCMEFIEDLKKAGMVV